MSHSFYDKLRSFTSFSEIITSEHYVRVPDDWYIIITDIRGSTQAISEGRYKDVNTIGAATIVVTRSVIESDFPFVFGGDGATLLVHQSQKDAVLRGLCALKKLAQSGYNLNLRVGAVSIEELSRSQLPIEVAKLEITRGRSIACLRGPGVSAAERWIKDPSGKHIVDIHTEDTPLLSELTCRWSPIPSKRGNILTLIVSSLRGSDVYRDFLNELGRIIPEGLDSANPTHMDVARYNTFWTNLKHEAKLHSIWSLSFWKNLFSILVTDLIFRKGILRRADIFNQYEKSVAAHSDYRKFDETLRMVIDCSREQADQIIEYLRKEHAAGSLCYGHLITDSSLMTCVVQGLGQGQHIHFIDASHGGYAAAAVELKKQLKKN